MLREIVTTFLAQEARDPRIGMVTVTRVQVTGDMRRAVVHYVVHGDSSVQAQTAEGLQHAALAVRREAGRQLKLRLVPELVFEADHGAEHSSRIEELLAGLRKDGGTAP